jgi:hypothetical protein
MRAESLFLLLHFNYSVLLSYMHQPFMIFHSYLSTLGFPFLNFFVVIIEPLDNSWIRLNVFLNINEVSLHFEPAVVESIVVEPLEPSFQ